MNRNVVVLVRLALSLLFLVSGAQKLVAPARMAPLFAALGLPARTALAIGVFELVAAAAFLAGFRTRPVAAMLAAWCLVTAFVGHRFWVDPAQIPNFLKNVGLAGAFLLFAVPGPLSTAERRDGQGAR